MPWVLFMVVSFMPLVFVFLVSEIVLGLIKGFSEIEVSVVEFSW